MDSRCFKTVGAALFLLSCFVVIQKAGNPFVLFGQKISRSWFGQGGPGLVFYNKVGKCASSSLLSLADKLRYSNGFTVYQHQLGSIPHKKKPAPEDLKKEVDIVSSLPTPGIYARHVYFINFTNFGRDQPVYINMIRDPVDRFVSNFYFQQVGSKGQNLAVSHPQNVNDCIFKNHSRCSNLYERTYITRFLCGQESICASDDLAALTGAKSRLHNDYLFVGITEEFENSLRILEKVLPNFFRGAVVAWKEMKWDMMNQYATKFKDELHPKAREIMKKRLVIDYELYNYAKKLFDQKKHFYGIQ